MSYFKTAFQATYLQWVSLESQCGCAWLESEWSGWGDDCNDVLCCQNLTGLQTEENESPKQLKIT